MDDVTDEAVYLYAIASVEDAEALPAGKPGIDPSFPLELVPEGRLVGLASRVVPSELRFAAAGDEVGAAPLEEMVRAHDRVLVDAGEAKALLPVRFGTILPDRASLHELLRQRGPELEADLATLRGKREWGVKGLLVRDAVEAFAVAADPTLRRLGDAAADGTGSAFFARKRFERELQARVAGAASEIAGSAHAQFATIASEAALNPPQRPEVSGYAEEMVLNGAYLVDRGLEDELRVAVDELEQRFHGSASFHLTGPWPPFNFVHVDLGSAT